MRAAARRAGVSQAAPYNHFADKAALLAAIAALGFKEFAAAMRHEMSAAEDPRARLNATGIAYVAFATSNPGLFKLMFGSSVREDPVTRIWMARGYPPTRCWAGPCMLFSVGPRNAAQDELESLRSWALVHGLATMINEGTLTPDNYGARSV